MSTLRIFFFSENMQHCNNWIQFYRGHGNRMTKKKFLEFLWSLASTWWWWWLRWIPFGTNSLLLWLLDIFDSEVSREISTGVSSNDTRFRNDDLLRLELGSLLELRLLLFCFIGLLCDGVLCEFFTVSCCFFCCCCAGTVELWPECRNKTRLAIIKFFPRKDPHI